MKRLTSPASRPAPSRLELMRSHYNHLAVELRGLEVDLRWGLDGSDRIPKAWSDIAFEPFCPTKQKLSMRVDEDVLRFFRATGQGYLTRMNKVLRTYMLARLAGVVQGAERAKPAPLLGEEYLAETAVYMELNARRKARAAAGQNVVDMDVELARMEPRLRWMERELTEALERLGEGSEAG